MQGELRANPGTERLREAVIAKRCPRGGGNGEAKLPVGRRNASAVRTAWRGPQRRRAGGRFAQPAAFRARVRALLPTWLRRLSWSRTCRFPGDGERESRQVLRTIAGRKLRGLRSCPGDFSLFPTHAYGMLGVVRAVPVPGSVEFDAPTTTSVDSTARFSSRIANRSVVPSGRQASSCP